MLFLFRSFSNLIVIFGLFLFAPIYGQEQSSSVELNVIIYPWLPRTPLPSVVKEGVEVEQYEPSVLNLYMLNRGRSVSLSLRENVIGRWMPYSGDRTFQLFSSDSADGEMPLPVAELVLPDNARDVLLILYPKEDGRFELYPIILREKDFEEGQIKIVNFGGKSVIGKAGDRRLDLQAGAILDYYVAEGIRGERIAFAYQQDAQWKPFFDSFVAKPNGAISLLFVYPKATATNIHYSMRRLVVPGPPER